MLAVLSLCFALRPALADEISIQAMDDFEGESTEAFGDTDYVVEGYKQVVRELGATIANKPMAPGESLGISGFNIGLSTTFSFIRTGSLDGTYPAGWDLSATDEEPSTYLFIPWVTVRKGLPLSFEIGANAGWIGMTQTGVFGGWARWSLVEGYKPFPDLALQVGYAGYVGNEELEVGVMDMSATVGYTLPFGVTKGINQASFAPFLSIGQTRFHGAPRGDLSRTGLEERIVEVSGFQSAKSFDKTFAPVQIGGGFRILSGDFTATIASTYTVNVLPTVSMGFGFTY